MSASLEFFNVWGFFLTVVYNTTLLIRALVVY